MSNTVLYYEQLIKGYVCRRCQKKLKIHCKGCDAKYVKGVKRDSKHTVRVVMLYVEGVERSSKYTVKAVMLCMVKVSKETQNTL